MKSFISDTEDLKEDPSYQETWDDMIINVSMTESWTQYSLVNESYFLRSTWILIKYIRMRCFIQVNGILKLFCDSDDVPLGWCKPQNSVAEMAIGVSEIDVIVKVGSWIDTRIHSGYEIQFGTQSLRYMQDLIIIIF